MMNKNQNIGLLLLRVSIAFTMLIYGLTKLINGIEGIKAVVVNSGLPALLGYGIFIGEILAPILIIVGYRTRIAGVVFTINCLMAIILVQLPNLLKLNESGGWQIGLLVIYTVFGLSMFLIGAGQYALSSNNKWD